MLLCSTSKMLFPIQASMSPIDVFLICSKQNLFFSSVWSCWHPFGHPSLLARTIFITPLSGEQSMPTSNLNPTMKHLPGIALSISTKGVMKDWFTSSYGQMKFSVPMLGWMKVDQRGLVKCWKGKVRLLFLEKYTGKHVKKNRQWSSASFYFLPKIKKLKSKT